MIRIDLDDLPPRLATLLTAAAEGEEVILVRNGAVAGRLTGGAPVVAQPPEPPSQEDAKQVFEDFRSMIEDEF